MIEDLERVVNHVSDTDLEWGPFLFLRPERHERMTSLQVAQLAALYGGIGGLFATGFARLLGEHAGSLHPLFFPLTATLGFFAFYRLTFAACWNRRAERLSRGARE